MLTHTGRTYDPGSPLPLRCSECEAPATWLWHHSRHDRARLCVNHAHERHYEAFLRLARESAPCPTGN